MFNAEGEILYIGKAKNLKARVTSYFIGESAHSLKTKILVSQIDSIETIVTKSEKEALVLENQLIKYFRPRYNIQLKDDKHYPYIKVTTHEPFPTVLVVRKKLKDNAHYFGPYPSFGSSRKMLRLIYQLFPLRDCEQAITLTEKQPKCLKLDLEKCIGPCVFKEIKTQYDDLVAQLLLLLEGKNKRLIGTLQTQMQLASDAQKFELAASLRDKINRIELLSEKQNVDSNLPSSVHVFGAIDLHDYYYLIIHTIVEGKLLFQQGLYCEDTLNTPFETFIQQSALNFYQDKSLPNELIVSEEIQTAINPLELCCKITQPIRGRKKEILELAQRNAKLSLYRLLKAQTKAPAIQEDYALQTLLCLKSVPKNIIGVDISHYYGTQIVASAVYFQNGRPKKQLYRQYKINSVNTGKSNDPASIYEVVLRRLHECMETPETLPDLLLIDGGKPQLNAALDALKSLPLPSEIPTIGLAKKLEELYFPNQKEPMRVDQSDTGLLLLRRIRDESHRFALKYQRNRRKDTLKQTILHQIQGVGEQRIQKLYKTFKSIDAIKMATPQEIAKVDTIGPELAKKIHAVLNS